MRMNPKKCPACNQLSSSQAPACLSCGYAFKRENILRGENVWKMIAGIVIIFGGLFLLYWLGHAVLESLVNAIPCCS